MFKRQCGQYILLLLISPSPLFYEKCTVECPLGRISTYNLSNTWILTLTILNIIAICFIWIGFWLFQYKDRQFDHLYGNVYCRYYSNQYIKELYLRNRGGGIQGKIKMLFLLAPMVVVAPCHIVIFNHSDRGQYLNTYYFKDWRNQEYSRKNCLEFY